jgi:serine/threonine protein kinase
MGYIVVRGADSLYHLRPPRRVMHVRCPICDKPVEIVGETDFIDVTCPSCGSSFNLLADASTVSRGHSQVERIAHFELLEVVGVGGFGTVWKARDTELDRIVALKTPRTPGALGEDQELFGREPSALGNRSVVLNKTRASAVDASVHVTTFERGGFSPSQFRTLAIRHRIPFSTSNTTSSDAPNIGR